MIYFQKRNNEFHLKIILLHSISIMQISAKLKITD